MTQTTHHNTRHSAALMYLAAGLVPIPLDWPDAESHSGSGRARLSRDIGKRPLLGDDYQDVRPDANDIERWWRRWPEANVGLLLEPSGLFVIDTDCPEATAAVRECGVESAMVVATGNGFHFYYKRPPRMEIRRRIKVRKRQGWLWHVSEDCPKGKGVDLLARGYVVAGPSRHRNGHQYGVLDPNGLVYPPAWAVKLFDPPTPKPRRASGERIYTDNVDLEELADALRHVDPDCDMDTYVKVGAAIHDASGGSNAGYSLFDDWASGSVSGKYNPRESPRRWRTFKAGGGITARYIFKLAYEGGWGGPPKPPPRPVEEFHAPGPDARVSEPFEDVADEPPPWMDEVPPPGEPPPSSGQSERTEGGGASPPESPGGSSGSGGGRSHGEGRYQRALEGDMHTQALTVLDVLDEINDEEPFVFLQGRDPVWVVKNSEGRCVIEEFLPRNLRALVQSRVEFTRWDKRGKSERTVNVSLEVATNALSFPEYSLDELRGIARTPFFGPDWELVQIPGYHPSVKLFLDLVGFEPLRVPRAPTREQLEEARQWILDELLVDFPFDDESSRTHAVCMGLLPFVRAAFEGNTPLHLVTAPTPRSGKGKLIDVLMLATTACDPMLLPPTRDNEEMRKAITATLRDAPTAVKLDNLDPKCVVTSENLVILLTQRMWTARDLGRSRNVSFPNKTVWTATGNNPKVSKDLAERCVWIHLDPKVADPSSRRGFKHDPIEQWAERPETRARATAAFMTLVRWWLSKGARRSDVRMGGFEAWAAIMGGICDVCGLPGFLGNRSAMRERIDAESEQWAVFVAVWWEKYQGKDVTAADLNDLCDTHNMMENVRGTKGAQSEKIRLGKELISKRDKIFEFDHRGLRYAAKLEVRERNSNKKTQQYGLGLLSTRELAQKPTQGGEETP